MHLQISNFKEAIALHGLHAHSCRCLIQSDLLNDCMCYMAGAHLEGASAPLGADHAGLMRRASLLQRGSQSAVLADLLYHMKHVPSTRMQN